MATRPSQDPKWAESAPSENIEEPNTERPDGYSKDETRPSDQFNWLMRELFNWVEYFDGKFQGSTGLVDFFSDIDFGDNASWSKNTDNATDYEKQLDHDDVGGVAKVVTDIWSSLSYHETPEIRSDTASPVDVKNTNGNFLGFVLERLVPSSSSDLINITDDAENAGLGGFVLSLLRPQADDVIDVQNRAGTSGHGGLLASLLKSGGGAFGVGVPDAIDFRDESGGSGLGVPVGINTAKSGAFYDFSGGAPPVGNIIPSTFKWGGILSAYRGVGDYTFEFNYTPAPVVSSITGDVQIMGSDTNSYNTRVDQSAGTDEIRVRIFDDTGTLTDPPSGQFFVKFYFKLS